MKTETKTHEKPAEKETPKATKNAGVTSGPDETPKKIDPASQPIHEDGQVKVNDGSGGGGFNKVEN